MGYWTYYLAWALFAYGMRYPWLALGAVVFYALRRFIPDPFVFFRTAGRIGALKQQIQANAANVTARRDLAEIWLQRMRPRAALRLLEEAGRRAQEDPEILYLTGVARLRIGDAEGALEPLVKAVDIDPRIRFGEPYLVAAQALVRLRRLEEAEDALLRYVRVNTSSIEGLVRLAQVERERGEREAAKNALREAFLTWHQVPPFRRRKDFGWWVRGQFMRIGVL